MTYKINEDHIIIEGVLVRMVYDVLPTFGKKSSSEMYYQIAIRAGVPDEKTKDFLMSEGVFGNTDSAFIPKWVKDPKKNEDGTVFINLKSSYEIKITTDGKTPIKWGDFISQHGEPLGSLVKVSCRAVPGAIYPNAIWFTGEIVKPDLGKMF